MDEETQVPLSKEQQALRDEAVSIIAAFDQAGQLQARTIGRIMTIVLTLEYQVVALATELEILKGDKNA